MEDVQIIHKWVKIATDEQGNEIYWCKDCGMIGKENQKIAMKGCLIDFKCPKSFDFDKHP